MSDTLSFSDKPGSV